MLAEIYFFSTNVHSMRGTLASKLLPTKRQEAPAIKDIIAAFSSLVTHWQDIEKIEESMLAEEGAAGPSTLFNAGFVRNHIPPPGEPAPNRKSRVTRLDWSTMDSQVRGA